MKPVIGIIMRDYYSKIGHKIKYTYNDIENAIIKSGGIPIGIPNNDIIPYLNICHGFILKGGDNIDNNDLKLIRVLHEKNIPLLGICLGMQEMGIVFDGKETKVNNHINNDYQKTQIHFHYQF